MASFLAQFDIWQMIPAFIFLIAIVDPFGNIPITISLEHRGVKISPWKVSLASVIILIAFLLAGEWLLKIFDVKIEYFAIAGGFVIFLMALEMILDVRIFQNESLDGEGSIVPLAFPMYAGPGAMTAEYNTVNMIFAIVLSIIVLYFVLVGTHWLNKYLGQTALYIIRKFFGIIVLAISVKLIFGNLALVL